MLPIAARNQGLPLVRLSSLSEDSGTEATRFPRLSNAAIETKSSRFSS